jgi:hypothetical protein
MDVRNESMGVDPARRTEATAGRAGPGVLTDLERRDGFNWPWTAASDLRAARVAAARAALERGAPRTAATAGMASAVCSSASAAGIGHYLPNMASSRRGWKKPASALKIGKDG